MMRTKNTIVFLLLLLSFRLSAQSDSTKFEFSPSINLYTGYLVPNFKNGPESKIALFGSAQITWQTNGKDHWHQFAGFPIIGAELFYSDFGNPTELGFNLGFVPVVQFTHSKKRVKRYTKLGMGAAYFNKPFDAITNENNLYVGSHVANMSIASMTWDLPMKNNNSILLGINAVHCSDGHVALPNAGMNFVMAHFGYRFNSVSSLHPVRSSQYERANTYSGTLKFSLGVHEFGETTKAVGGPVYPSYHLSFHQNQPLHQLQLIQVGAVISYYESFYDYIKTQQFYTTKQKLRASTAVITFGHEFFFGKISFSSVLGIYVYNKFYKDHKKYTGDWKGLFEKAEGINTNRLGLLYYPFKQPNALNKINKQLAIGIFLKANLGQADCFEFSAAYTF